MESGEQYLSGPVKVVRGQYDILGRRFNVVEGKVDFLGNKEMNPPILLEAEYNYRTSGREKKDLILKVTGDLKTPIIKFYVDNSEISQEDAISIVLFGRRKDELSYASQADISGSDMQNTAAMGIVSNIISDRLSRSVGDDLKLDVIEVNAQDNWQSANFVIGKYITEDIFVTYKREFGQNKDNSIVPETISLEYEITKFLYLQLIQGDPKESGTDLFFKFDWD
jgi:autotransporter translocation and assembly factor TamB